MSSQLVDTDRRRLRVTRVEVLKNRNQARQPAKKTPPLTSRRQLRVELPHFHNEIFPDSPAPTLQGFQRPSSLNNFLRHHERNLDSRAATGLRRLRITRVTVLDPMIPDVSPPRHLSPDVDTSSQNYLLPWLSFFARAMKPLRRKGLIGVLALLGYSVVWLCRPDPTSLILQDSFDPPPTTSIPTPYR